MISQLTTISIDTDEYTRYKVIIMMKHITSKLSDVRGELFGFSIITIILFHFCEDVEKADFCGVT